MEPIFYMTDDPVVRKELVVPVNQRLERAVAISVRRL